MIKSLITQLQQLIPVIWDRYTEESGDYNIYGWIERKDGKRDFVLLQLYFSEGEIKGGFVTSSAKYSETIHEFLYDSKGGHNSCKKIENLNA